MTFGTYEEGKIDLDTYLDRVAFNRRRSFWRAEYREHMYAQSKPHTDMLGLARGLKSRYGLRVAAVSNESREHMIYRIETFKLREIMDFFIASCFVHFRKPDEDPGGRETKRWAQGTNRIPNHRGVVGHG